MIKLIKSRAVGLSTLIVLSQALPVMAENLRPLTFKDKHPKIYYAFKKGRTACHFALPFIQCAGSIAQVFTPFVVN